eukprot:CAMPEP_0174716862 /NCGR_PEP_ID=MMETSP1094-20130205/24990_1 /TAXON_ID=156173 /ORGANISM="Chrysochromulina brevifilum, Strain UTEX LB 985" /LENGTH=393 /DNA_ID=CAMNT_0015916711 /DNA_START=51 /DNA_END=1232 /DNA_ORIENTATION=+
MEKRDKSDFVFDKGDVLGRGGYAKVCTGRNVRTGQLVAAKIISTSRMKMSAIERERALLARLDHPNIISLYGFEDRGKEAILYMELAGNGTLFTRVTSTGCLTEGEARPYMGQILAAILYLEGVGVVHRDLKLENILIDSSDVCKISDFGLAHAFERHQGGEKEEGKRGAKEGELKLTTLHEVCGSKSYAAPEVLEGAGYDGFAVDLWSCGICAFAMLAGFFPLDEATISDWRYERVRQADAARASVTHTVFGFYDRACDLSEEAVDIIDGLLALDPSRRLSAKQALGSEWLSIKGGEIKRGESESKGGVPPVYRGARVHGYRGDAVDTGRASDLLAASPMASTSSRGLDAAMIAALYKEEEEVRVPTIYRSVPRAPPPLTTQRPIHCDALRV